MPEDKSWKDNHMIVSFGMISVVAAALTAIGTISGMYDAGHTSQAELETYVDAAARERADLRQQMEAQSREGTCQNLAIRIAIVEQVIWDLETSGSASARLVEKRRQLADLVAQYDDLRCATVLNS